jgi:hypothetical protein
VVSGHFLFAEDLGQYILAGLAPIKRVYALKGFQVDRPKLRGMAHDQ